MLTALVGGDLTATRQVTVGLAVTLPCSADDTADASVSIYSVYTRFDSSRYSPALLQTRVQLAYVLNKRAKFGAQLSTHF